MPSVKSRPLTKRPQHIPLRAWMAYWLLVSVLIVFIILNSFVVLSENTSVGQSTSTAQTVQNLVNELRQVGEQSDRIEKNVNDLQARVNKRETMDEVRASLTKTADDRLQLTTAAAKALLPCDRLEDYPFYNATTTQTAVINLSTSTRVRVPYDTRWGNAEFALTSSEQNQDQWNATSVSAVRFGAMRVTNKLTCDWERDYKILILPQRTADQAIEAENTRVKLSSVLLEVQSTKATIGTRQAVRFISSNPETKTSMEWTEVMGINQNYIFIAKGKQGVQAAIDNMIRSLVE